jgi:Asp-tRNA(Asn)/Glu-tRNA(Gln) amidotransferase A subunit family amidase
VPIRKVSENDVRKLRVGVLEIAALGSATPETKAAVENAAKILREHGFAVETKCLSGLERAIELWWYFFGPVIAHLIKQGAVGKESKMSPMLREFVAISTTDTPMAFDSFEQACAERDVLRAVILRQMDDARVLLSPVSSGPAFQHGEGNWRLGEKECYRETMRFAQWLNFAGFPGMAVPLGTSPEGLPIGVQVIGRPHEEEVVMAVAEAIESGRGPWLAPPALTA